MYVHIYIYKLYTYMYEPLISWTWGRLCFFKNQGPRSFAQKDDPLLRHKPWLYYWIISARIRRPTLATATAGRVECAPRSCIPILQVLLQSNYLPKIASSQIETSYSNYKHDSQYERLVIRGKKWSPLRHSCQRPPE